MAGGSEDPLKAPLTISRPPQYYINVAKRWTPSAVSFGAFAGMMFLYFTDWQIFMDKVPLYRSKFEEREPLTKL